MTVGNDVFRAHQRRRERAGLGRCVKGQKISYGNRGDRRSGKSSADICAPPAK